MRTLSREFMDALLYGELKEVLQVVRTDDTLSMELRTDYVAIYFRGGNILRINKMGKHYQPIFDFHYCQHRIRPSIYEPQLWRLQTVPDWIRHMPAMKAEVDLWRYEHPRRAKEMEQFVCRSNNYSPVANETDYYIADLLYNSQEIECKANMIGIKWPSIPEIRRDRTAPSLVFFELKYGDQNLTGENGLIENFRNICRCMEDQKTADLIMDDAESMINQKAELNLLRGMKKSIILNRKVKPEFVLMFLNHKPSKTALLNALKDTILEVPEIFEYVDVKVAQASSMGYGLYESQMIDVRDFVAKLEENRIHFSL